MIARDGIGPGTYPFDYEMDPTERFSEAVTDAAVAVPDYDPVGKPFDGDRVPPPLSDLIDLDALDALLGPTPDEGRGVDNFSFDDEEFAVSVESSGTVRVGKR